MARRVTTDAASAAFAAVVREAAEAAANGNRTISKTEEKSLPAYLQARSQEVREQGGRGTRVSVDALVSVAAAHARAQWARFNPEAGRDGRTLSRDEVRAIGQADPALGELTFRAYERVREGQVVGRPFAPVPVTDARYATTHPSARFERVGDLYVLTSDASGAVTDPDARHRGTLTVGGHQVSLDASPDGVVAAFGLASALPEGYSFESVHFERTPQGARHSFRLFADPPGTLRADAARDVARAGLLAYIRDTRMHQPDWQSCGLPTTWDALRAAGIEDQCAAFGDFPDAAGDGRLERRPDTYSFVGRGPLGLYTEVEVGKRDGKVARVYVEID